MVKPGMLRAWAWALTAAMSMPAGVMAAGAAAREMQEALHARPNVARGAVFFRVCATCHGEDGGGSPGGLTPRIGGQHYSVLVRQLISFRHGERSDLLMQHFTNRHYLASAQSIADVAAYVSRLRPRAAPGVGDGTLVPHGVSVYTRLCASCHGPSGEGSARRAVPRIGGQDYEYLREEIGDAVTGQRRDFSRSHIRLLARLQPDDITGIADFLSRAQAPDRGADTPQGARSRQVVRLNSSR